MLALSIAILIGYLLGSIPTAYLVVRVRGQDVFTLGTRNPGAANVFRTVGRREGIMVLLGDALKGVAAVNVAAVLGVDEAWLVLPGAASVLGHLHSVFLGFRGGGGLATTIGVSMALMPLAGVIGAVPGLLALAVSHNTGWSSGLGFTVAVVVAWPLGYEPMVLLGVLLLAFAIMVRAHLLDWWAAKQRELSGGAL